MHLIIKNKEKLIQQLPFVQNYIIIAVSQKEPRKSMTFNYKEPIFLNQVMDGWPGSEVLLAKKKLEVPAKDRFGRGIWGSKVTGRSKKLQKNRWLLNFVTY